jgi:hypothetical protein
VNLGKSRLEACRETPRWPSQPDIGLPGRERANIDRHRLTGDDQTRGHNIERARSTLSRLDVIEEEGFARGPQSQVHRKSSNRMIRASVDCMSQAHATDRGAEPASLLRGDRYRGVGESLAEGMRFELTVRVDPVQRFSKPPPSATRPPLRREKQT